MKVVTGKVRFSYVNVFQPRAAAEGQEPKYSVCIMIPKSDKETVKKIQEAIEKVKEENKNLWGGSTNIKTPLRDGDEERKDKPEFAGHYFINASTKIKPGVVDKDLNPILEQSEFYSGCYGRASLNFYAYNKAGNKGIGCGLRNLQKLADGEPLGGQSRPEDDFEAVEDDLEDMLA